MKILSLFLLFLLPLLSKGQDTLVVYYNSDWDEISQEKKAVFYRKLYQVSEDTWQAKDYFIEGNLQMVGQFKSELTKERKGIFTYYFKNGQVESTGLFVDNNEEGEWLYYYENGKIKKEAIFDNGNCIIERKHDENGKITVVENPYNFAEINPEFPGGNAAMSAFIGKEFSYPEYSREMGEQGTVYVEFVVQKNGQLDDIKIVKGVSKHLDAEVVRVIKAMPKWKPGQQDGVPVNVRFTIPIKCRLGNTKKKKKKWRN